MMRKTVITGSEGLVGKCLVNYLTQLKYDIIGVDRGGDVEINDLYKWIDENRNDIDFVIHLGANTNVFETSDRIFEEYNTNYSKSLWYKCMRFKIPIIYASSSATYGDGKLGYDDNIDPKRLTPLNKYGISKNEFDKFVTSHNHLNDAPFWAGLKFFNIYGYNESHKRKMASFIYQVYKAFKKQQPFELYDVDRARDFIYVEDVVSIIHWMMTNRPTSSIYNIGTGKATKFSGMVEYVANALGIEPSIKHIPMPEKMKVNHQFFTEANITKLRGAGYNNHIMSPDEGIKKYVKILEQHENKNINR